jgi:hypothetical protein
MGRDMQRVRKHEKRIGKPQQARHLGDLGKDRNNVSWSCSPFRYIYIYIGFIFGDNEAKEWCGPVYWSPTQCVVEWNVLSFHGKKDCMKIGEARLHSVHDGFRGWNCGVLRIFRWISWWCGDDRGGHFLDLRCCRSQCNVRSPWNVRRTLTVGSPVCLVVIVARLRPSFPWLHCPFSFALVSLCMDTSLLITKVFSVLRHMSTDDAKSSNPSSLQHGPKMSRKSWRILVEFWALKSVSSWS